jgi:hypothetical protein
MAIITAALTTMEVLDQVRQVYDSTDPLLIRFRNTLKEKAFVVEYIGGLQNMELKNVTSNFIPPGSVTDFAFAAGSWDNAFVSIEIRGQQEGVPIRIQLDYDWISAEEANIKIKTHPDDIKPDDEPGKYISEGKKIGPNTKAIRHSKWGKFDIILISTGKLVEMTVIEKGIM